ncbi:MAG: cation diffusion facilitator family transporter [Anaerolineales bacterium]
MNQNHPESSRSVQLHRRATRLEGFTILWNIVEAAIAIGSGAVAGSTALLAFGADSLIEVSSGVAVFWRLIRVGPTASPEESDTADRRAHFLVGITFFLLAAWVLQDAIRSLILHEIPNESPVGIVLAIASLLVMPLLAYAKQRTGREMGSKALEADAVETWLCAYLSATLLLGLLLHSWFGLWWSDPAAGLAMVPFMIWQGFDTVKESRSEEVDESTA